MYVSLRLTAPRHCGVMWLAGFAQVTAMLAGWDSSRGDGEGETCGRTGDPGGRLSRRTWPADMWTTSNVEGSPLPARVPARRLSFSSHITQYGQSNCFDGLLPCLIPSNNLHIIKTTSTHVLRACLILSVFQPTHEPICHVQTHWCLSKCFPFIRPFSLLSIPFRPSSSYLEPLTFRLGFVRG